MKVVAAVNYFDEPLDHTDRLLTSLVGFVDEVVVLDGAYRLFPHETPGTDPSRLSLVYNAGFRLGLTMNVIGCKEAYENQTTKRTRLMNIAAGAGRGGYVLVIDADEWIDRDATDIEKLRYKMEKHQPDAIAVSLDTPPPPRRSRAFNLGTQSPEMSTSVHGNGVERMYRSMNDFVIGPTYHGSVSATNELGERLCLRKRKQENADLESAVRLDAKGYFRIVNGTWTRDAARLKQKGTYGQKRARSHEDA